MLCCAERSSGGDQPSHRNGVPLGEELLLLLGAELIRVGEGVAAEAVGLRLDEGRAVPAARASDGLGRNLANLSKSGGAVAGVRNESFGGRRLVNDFSRDRSRTRS